MSNITRAERERRHAIAPGTPDDTVWAKGISANQHGDTYHETRGCRAILPDETYTSMTRHAAHLRWLVPCRYCSLADVKGNGRPVETDGGDTDE